MKNLTATQKDSIKRVKFIENADLEGKTYYESEYDSNYIDIDKAVSESGNWYLTGFRMSILVIKK